MSTTRFLSEAIVTADESGSVFRPGVLDVEDGLIRWVGDQASAPLGPTDTVTVGGLVMPGLVNTHGHTPMTLLRSAGDGLALEPWLRDVIWPLEAHMTDEDVYWGMRLGCDELLLGGITTTCEQYLHNRSVVDAVLEAGIRCVLTPGVFDLPDAGPEGKWQHMLAEAHSTYHDFDDPGGLLRVGIGPHSVYALPTEALVGVAELAGKTGGLIQIHVAETMAEGRTVEELHGCSAPQLLKRLGIFEHPVLAAHSVWLSDDDLDLYQANDVAVAHCPQSNGKLGSGVARLADMLARGIRVGLGTDGPASNDNLDLWEELRLAPVLARAVAADPGAVTTAQALGLATRGGARALGLETGSLEPGRPADFIRLDLDDASFVPSLDDGDLVAHLVWSASSRLVTDVWVAGKAQVRAGVRLSSESAECRRQVSMRARRLRKLAGLD